MPSLCHLNSRAGLGVPQTAWAESVQKRKPRGQYKLRGQKFDPIEFGREMEVAISGFFVVGEQLPVYRKRKAALAASMGLKIRSTKFCTAWDQLKDHKFRLVPK